MPLEIAMPRLSESMTEGDVVAWLVAEGAVVRAGEPIAEIETDKSTVELEAPEDGTLARILVPAGAQAIAVGSALALLERAGEAASAPAASRHSVAVDSRAASVHTLETDASPASLELRASPLARRMAAQARLELSAVTGSGAQGRVLRADVERALGRAAARTPARALAAVPAATANAAPESARSGRDVPLSRARRTAAARLTAAKTEIPHFYLHVECELGELFALRERLNRSDGRHITLTDFAVRAAALALRDVPELNASFAGDRVRLHDDVDVAVAVASDAGLTTQVVRRADRKTLVEISAEIRALAERARAGRLDPREYASGTFTVSNLGMFGVDGLYAIVNPPQAAILGVGRARPRPVARGERVLVAPVAQLTLSADHRVVDGALGARLLGAIRARLEDPLELLL